MSKKLRRLKAEVRKLSTCECENFIKLAGKVIEDSRLQQEIAGFLMTSACDISLRLAFMYGVMGLDIPSSSRRFMSYDVLNEIKKGRLYVSWIID